MYIGIYYGNYIYRVDTALSIITIATSKGGAGKTTLAQVLIGTLDAQGHSVAVIDSDLNSTLSGWIKNFSELGVACEAVLEETRLVQVAEELENKHDLVVIDTAGAATQATVFAIGCADLVLIPIQLSSADVIEAIKTYDLVQSASKMVKREIPARIIFTDYTPNTNIAGFVEQQVKQNKLPAMKTKLNRLVAFKELTFTGVVPVNGTAGAQAQLLVQEIQKMGVIKFKKE